MARPAAKTPARKPAAKSPPSAPAPAAAAPRFADPITRNAVVIMAVVACGAALYFLRGILTPLALALFLAIMVDSFARRLEERWPRLPDPVSLAAAIALSLLIFGVAATVVAASAAQFVPELDGYAPKLDSVIANISHGLGLEPPKPLTALVADLRTADHLRQLASGLQGIASDAFFVLIYLGFIIAARRGFKRKIVALFPHNQERAEAIQVFNRIRNGVELYLWVQTVTGLMIAGGSWLVLVVFGVENALFWSFLIFLASYIPIIGGFIGIVFPALFALIQFPEWWPAIVILGALWGIQTFVGNVIQPKMQGDSLNIDPVVVLLALAVWGLLWGLPGMFLSTPLAVMAMIILAEFEGSRWIAVLMSENGDPQGVDENGHRRRHKQFGRSDRTP